MTMISNKVAQFILFIIFLDFRYYIYYSIKFSAMIILCKLMVFALFTMYPVIFVF